MPLTIFDASPSRPATRASDPTNLHLELHHASSIEWAVSRHRAWVSARQANANQPEAGQDSETAFVAKVLSLPRKMTVERWIKELEAEARLMGIALTIEDRRKEAIEAAIAEKAERARQRAESLSRNGPSLLRGRLDGRAGLFAAESPSKGSPRSLFSIPEDPVSPTPRLRDRLLRSLKVLKLARAPSPPPGSCPGCPHAWAQQCKAEHHLECGHIVCTRMVMKKVVAFCKTFPVELAPRCCDVPIREHIIKAATIAAEKPGAFDVFLVKIANNGIGGFSEPTVELTLPVSPIHPPPSTPRLFNTLRRVKSQMSPRRLVSSLPSSPAVPRSIAPVDTSNHPEVEALKNRQAEQKTRFERWATDLRAALQDKHDMSRNRLDKHKGNEIDQTHAEHEQARLEFDMKYQAQEDAMLQEQIAHLTELENEMARHRATLRRMRSNNEHEERAIDMRTVTQELQRLEARYSTLETDHENSMDRLRVQKEKEKRELQGEHDAECFSMEYMHERMDRYAFHHIDREEIRLAGYVAAKYEFLQERWGLEMAVHRKKISLGAFARPNPDCDIGPMSSPFRGLAIDQGTF